MYSRQNRRNTRANQLTKSGLKNENIDRQILVLHRAMAEKILQQPELMGNVVDKLESRHQEGRIHYGAYLTWLGIIEHLSAPSVFVQELLSDSPRMRKLRRKTPFVGVLTETEREKALLKYACGDTTIDSVL